MNATAPRPPPAFARRSTRASTTSTWPRATATPRTCWDPRSSPPQGGLPGLQDAGTHARGCEHRAGRLTQEAAHRPLRPLPAPCGDETQRGRDDPRPGGAMEAFEAARKAGKVRFLGFSAHSVEAALALLDGFPFDTLLFPVNYVTWSGRFRPAGARARPREGVGILALKAWPSGRGPRGDQALREVLVRAPRRRDRGGLALRFTLSHPVTAAIPPGDEGSSAWHCGSPRLERFRRPRASRSRPRGLATTPLFRSPSPRPERASARVEGGQREGVGAESRGPAGASARGPRRCAAADRRPPCGSSRDGDLAPLALQEGRAPVGVLEVEGLRLQARVAAQGDS